MQTHVAPSRLKRWGQDHLTGKNLAGDDAIEWKMVDGFLWSLPSGKLRVCYEKSPSWIGFFWWINQLNGAMASIANC